MAKPLTAYSAPTKPKTAYVANPSATAGVTLDSMTVRLDSITVRLTGYTAATPPSSTDKPSTVYAAATKPKTAYS